ncbi:hypothetical protein [Methanocorpusculum sp.]|uniref:hypothetical protein n=1 Tax=Methanocorpusculum sp. TaxID=2058474 RepID=UPI002B21CEEB|nr:hypothetical protein [Methanocorpusculum sp.]
MILPPDSRLANIYRDIYGDMYYCFIVFALAYWKQIATPAKEDISTADRLARQSLAPLRPPLRGSPPQLRDLKVPASKRRTNRIDHSMTAKPIIFPFPLSDTIMQAIDGDKKRTQMPVYPKTKQRILSRKREHQTYDDVLNILLDTVEIGDKGEEYGVIFLHSVFIGEEIKKLKKPLPLTLNIAENGYIQLANTEYSILVSSPNVKEAIEEAQLQFSDGFELFNNPALNLSPAAKARGERFKDAVWM